MKELTPKFSLTDFIAYLFPGFLFSVAFLTMLMLTPLDETLIKLRPKHITLSTGLLGVAFSYFGGILSSSFASITRVQYWISPFSEDIDLNSKIFFELKNQLRIAYKFFIGNDLFNSTTGPEILNLEKFYIIRAFLKTIDPNSWVIADRQNALRQMRRNCILPILMWGVSSMLLVLKYFENIEYYLIYIVLIGMMTFVAIASLVLGLKRNRTFEIRDCCFALVAEYRKRKLKI